MGKRYVLYYIYVRINKYYAIHTIPLIIYVGEISCPICTSQSVLLLAGIIPTVGLLLAQVATGVVVFLVTRHCYKKTSQKSSPSKEEHIYEQVEGRNAVTLL